MQFDIDPQSFHRLPQHPDWAYELWGGRTAHLSHRPRSVLFRRRTAWDRPTAVPRDARIELWSKAPGERSLQLLFHRIWGELDPYRSFVDRDTRLEDDVREGLAKSLFTITMVDDVGGLIGAVMVSEDRRSRSPFLSWLSVERSARQQGVATALLERACLEARSRNAESLMSAASVANVESLRWHLSRGFELKARDDI